MPRFAFRVNGNKDIGMGHLMRCLSLAALLGKDSLFIINNNHAVIEKVRACGFRSHVLTALQEEDFQVMVDALNHYPEKFEKKMPSERQEIERICPLLKKEKIDVLITDLIAVSRAYLETLKKEGLFLVSLDELGTTHFVSDLVFNCNAVSRTKKYRKEDYTKIYMGSPYALLRKEFSGMGKRILQDEVKRILVTCGGTDMKGLSLKILRALRPFSSKYEIVLLVGPDFKFREALNCLLQEMPTVVVKEDVQTMYEEMLQADLAIASGGTTMYELAACGTPGIILGQYGHQDEFATVLEKEGALVNLGIGENLNEQTIEKSFHALLDLDKRKRMSIVGQSMIDGKGAARVAQIIKESLH